MTVSGLAEATVTKLIGTGVQRVGSLVSQKIFRLLKIDAALKGNAKENPVVKAAIEDFQTVIGTYYGEFDQPLCDFMEEIKKGGIIGRMIENAMLDRRSDALQQLFTEAHETIIGKDRGNPQALYDRMMTSFSVSFRELCNDKAVAEFIRIVHANLGAKLEHLDEAIKALCCNRNDVSFEQIRPVLVRLAKGLQSGYRTIRVETNRGPREVEISKIYIPPKLTYRDTPLNAEKISAATRDLPEVLQKTLLSKSGPPSSGPLSNVGEGQVSQLKYSELKQTFSRVVVLVD